MPQEQDPVRIKQIQWLRVFPILNLWQSFRMAFRLRVLIPCLLASFVMFDGPSDTPTLENNFVSTSVDVVPLPLRVLPKVAAKTFTNGAQELRTAVGTFGFALLLIMIVGVSVARSTATEFCRETRTGAAAGLRFAVRRFSHALVSLGLAGLICGIPALLWWGASKTFSPTTEVGLIITLFACVLSMITTVVVTIAWLLSLSAVGTDSCEGSDALSRSISYVLSHKLYCLTLVILILGFAELARRSTYITLAVAMSMVMESKESLPSLGHTLLTTVPNSTALGVTLSGLTIAYILLRKAEDAIDLRELDGGQVRGSAASENAKAN